MSLPQAALLGAIQGLTEFLPVSSSAHLFLVPKLLGWTYEGLAFDVALHSGTLLALLIAFWRTWWTLIRDALAADSPRRSAARGIWLKLAVASVPAAAAGLLIEGAVAAALRSLPLQAATLFAFGFLLWWVDRVSPDHDDAPVPRWRACLLIGFAQCLALVPGVSRSGVTLTAGRAARLTRGAAARFSFLLATPITLGAVLVEARQLSGAVPAELAVGIATSAVVGLIAIQGLLHWIERGGVGVFFAYRTILALVIVLQWIRR